MLFPKAPALLLPRSQRTQRHGRTMARRTLIPEGETGERGNAKHAHTSVNPRHAPRPTPPAHNSEHPTPRTQRSTTQHRASRAQPISAQCCKGPPRRRRGSTPRPQRPPAFLRTAARRRQRPTKPSLARLLRAVSLPTFPRASLDFSPLDNRALCYYKLHRLSGVVSLASSADTGY